MQQAEEMWPCFDVGDGALVLAAGGEEVLHVAARGGGGEELRFLVLVVLGDTFRARRGSRRGSGCRRRGG